MQGEWLEDNFVGDFGSCDAAEALATAMDAENVAESARDFMYKPDGGARHRTRHALASDARDDACSYVNADVSAKMGLTLDQEPTIYTAGTEYLMPGPAGNLYKVPNDPNVRQALLQQARKALAAFQSKNMPAPPPDLLVRALCQHVKAVISFAHLCSAPHAPLALPCRRRTSRRTRRRRQRPPRRRSQLRQLRLPGPARSLNCRCLVKTMTTRCVRQSCVREARRDRRLVTAVSELEERPPQDDDDEPPAPVVAPRSPRVPGTASLSLSLVSNTGALARAFQQVGRSLRLRRLCQRSRQSL